ncbi:ATP-binding protein [Streptomyces leeuwenhoekii]|uniref:ATP-binding protein n=1 Tax=Streptomyces leeuwenhoekii TaxID=1437453 RepID=UPI0036A455C1
MSTTRPCSPGDRGPEPSGASEVPEGDVPVTEEPVGRAKETVVAAGGDPAAPSGSGGRQVRRLSFDGESGVVPLARDFTRQALYAWGWLPAATADQRAAAEDVLLVVSELVTNACLHAEGPDELRISCDRKVIRLEVSDRGTGQPSPRTPHRAGRPGGHGMFIVQRLCLDWGVVRTPGVAGKRVWAELGAPA